MRHVPLALALACCACSQADEKAAAAPSTAVTPAPEVLPEDSGPAPASITKPAALGPEGLGGIVVGQVPPASLKVDAVQISEGCQTHTDKARGISVMTDGKVVTRITAMRASKVVTAQGIGVRASEAQVRAAYPGAREEPHKYVAAPAKYLDWRPGGGDAGLRFEIDEQGKVNMIHAGREPYLSYVEGCA
jgi:hypothetical protein